MWNFKFWKRKKKNRAIIDPIPPPNGTLQYTEHKYSDVTAGKVSSEQFALYEPPPYKHPTDKEIIEGLEFCDNYEAAGLITHLKKQNMILKGKLTKLQKKYDGVIKT